MRVRLAGGFAVSADGADIATTGLGSRRGRQLLAVLVVCRPAVLTVDAIGDVLWPEESRPRAAEDIATLVSRLRKVIGAESIVGDRRGYRLGARIAVDLDEAAALLVEAARHPDAPALSASSADRALQLLAPGRPLPDAGDWAEPARTEWSALVTKARHLRVRSSIAVGEPAAAVRVALEAAALNRLDEAAGRDLMAAYEAAGESAKALAAYARLRAALADELGVDPAAATTARYLALLRAEQPPIEPVRAEATRAIDLVGRVAELDRVRRLWSAAVAGQPALLLIAGEAGIGKTALSESLAALAGQTGGAVSAVRCYATERSLLLQPFADVLRAALLTLPPAAVAEICGEHSGALCDVVPELATILGEQVGDRSVRGPADFRRRRAFEAVAGALTRLARRNPTLVVLDDLHDAGRSTVELLHYLAHRAGTTPLLIAATIQPERGAAAMGMLGDVAHVVSLGPLSAADVATLAGRYGRAELADALLGRTRGHPLFLVESLRAIVAGKRGVPDSLRAAVLSRVRGLPPAALPVLRAAAAFGTSVTLPDLIATAALPTAVVEEMCERALAAGLLVVAGAEFEFANDLTREVVYEATPAPGRQALHLRAADQLAGRPEALAPHAAAAGDPARAARAWLRAGEDAMRRYAASDANRMAGDALAAADAAADLELRGRALTLRGRALEVTADYPQAMDDLRAAAAVARDIGDRRLELTVLRRLGGDVLVALGLPASECRQHLNRGLALSRELGDHVAETYLLGRLAVLASNQLRFTESIALASRAVTASRATGDRAAIALALDGAKTGWAYLGEVDRLLPIVEELDGMFREQGDLWFLQWTAFEAAFAPLALGRYDDALAQIERANEINRRSGYIGYESWFTAHLGWVNRLAGRLDAARRLGRRACERSVEATHPWWQKTSAGFYAATLLEDGDRAAAVAVLERARSSGPSDDMASYELRCLAPLAEATGSAELLEQADAMLAAITAPDGSAWLLGADAYFCVARAWRHSGEPARARAALAPLRAAARRVPWVPLVAVADELQRTLD